MIISNVMMYSYIPLQICNKADLEHQRCWKVGVVCKSLVTMGPF